MENIIIYSGPVGSGKTKSLNDWIADKKGIKGILSPQVNGLRFIQDLETKVYHPLEVKEKLEPVVEIGKFIFLKAGLEKARDILINSALSKPEWLVIDPIGKLELQGEGFEPAARIVINLYITTQNRQKLILIVRKNLLKEVVQHYGINDYRLINNIAQLNQL